LKKIANIISENELVNHKKVNWIGYYDYKSWNDCDLSLPTLVVGWNKYKEHFPYLYPNILYKHLNPTNPRVMWEFSMEERVVDYFTGVESFVKKAPREYCELYEYISIDPIKHAIREEWDLIEKIPFSNSVMYQYKDEIIYILDRNQSKIYGIYLNAFRYFKYDTKKIMTLFSDRIEKQVIDLDGSLYQSFYKQFPNFDQLKRTIVLFLE